MKQIVKQNPLVYLLRHIPLQKPRILTFNEYAFLGFMVVAGIWSVLPVLVHGYNFPPNNDPYSYEGWISKIPFQQAYYGHWFGAIIGIPVYYYLTPILTAAGLVLAFRRYSVYAGMFAWVALWLIGRPALFEMHAGTFLAVVGLYVVCMLALSALSKWQYGEVHWSVPAAALLFAALFHNSSSAVVIAGASIFAVGLFIFTRGPGGRMLLLLLPALAYRVYAGLFLGTNAGFFLAPAKMVGLGPILDSIATSEIRTSYELTNELMNPGVFLGLYIGPGTTLLFGVAFLAAWNLWRSGWKPQLDLGIGVMVIVVVLLPLFIFTPWQLNSDRLAKIMVGFMIVLSSISIVQWVRILGGENKAKIAFSAGVVVVGIVVITLPENIQQWLAMGSIR